MDLLALPMWMYLVILTFVLMYVYVKYMSAKHGAFAKMGIQAPPPQAVLGNTGLAFKHGILEVQNILYRQYQNEKVYGFYNLRTPTLVIRDLDMVKEILVKNFNRFCDRSDVIEPSPPVDQSLLSLKGDHWRRVRSAVSPTFTSGRLKRVTSHIDRNTRVLLECLKQKQESNVEVELKELISRYTMDVVGSTAFGANIGCLEDPKGDFPTHAQKIADGMPLQIMIAMFFPFMSKLLRSCGIRISSDKSMLFMEKFVKEALNDRRHGKQTGKVNDFLDLVLEAEEQDGESDTPGFRHNLTTPEIHSQALTFLIAGYETTATILSFTLFSLANCPDLLHRAHEEVDSKLKGQFPSYDSVQDLDFLEMCVNEAMRMFPPGFVLDRQCTQDVSIQGVHIPKGMAVSIPVYAIHHDENIWPNPKQFQPERFLPENQESRHPYAFLPFGHGPRQCIGMRLAMLELKIALAAVLQRYSLVPCEKTIYPVQLGKMAVKAENGLWVKFEKR